MQDVILDNPNKIKTYVYDYTCKIGRDEHAVCGSRKIESKSTQFADNCLIAAPSIRYSNYTDLPTRSMSKREFHTSICPHLSEKKQCEFLAVTPRKILRKFVIEAKIPITR